VIALTQLGTSSGIHLSTDDWDLDETNTFAVKKSF
jgi:hypothetical protein